MFSEGNNFEGFCSAGGGAREGWTFSTDSFFSLALAFARSIKNQTAVVVIFTKKLTKLNKVPTRLKIFLRRISTGDFFLI